MSKIVAFISLTVDGVMQAPGRTDEDRRGGFEHGGWGIPYADVVMGTISAESGASSGGLLLGRRTYEDFYEVWPKRTDSPFSEILNNTQKYVASRTLKEPLPWRNSTLLKGDAADVVPELRKQLAKDLVVIGSGELLQSLMRHDLIDQYILLIHPLVLGSGRRLFADGVPPAELRLTDTKTTTTGVIVATYEPASRAEGARDRSNPAANAASAVTSGRNSK